MSLGFVPFDCSCGYHNLVNKTIWFEGGDFKCGGCGKIHHRPNKYGIRRPACPECGERFRVDKWEVDSQSAVACPSCGKNIKLGANGYRILRKDGVDYFVDDFVTCKPTVVDGTKTWYRLVCKKQLVDGWYGRLSTDYLKQTFTIEKLVHVRNPTEYFASLNLPNGMELEDVPDLVVDDMHFKSDPAWYCLTKPTNPEFEYLEYVDIDDVYFDLGFDVPIIDMKKVALEMDYSSAQTSSTQTLLAAVIHPSYASIYSYVYGMDICLLYQPSHYPSPLDSFFVNQKDGDSVAQCGIEQIDASVNRTIYISVGDLQLTDVPVTIQRQNCVPWTTTVKRETISVCPVTNLFVPTPRGIGVKGRFYSLKYYDLDEGTEALETEILPVVKADGTVCLYNKTENTFYLAMGTGTITPGPVKS